MTVAVCVHTRPSMLVASHRAHACGCFSGTCATRKAYLGAPRSHGQFGGPKCLAVDKNRNTPVRPVLILVDLEVVSLLDHQAFCEEKLVGNLDFDGCITGSAHRVHQKGKGEYAHRTQAPREHKDATAHLLPRRCSCRKKCQQFARVTMADGSARRSTHRPTHRLIPTTRRGTQIPTHGSRRSKRTRSAKEQDSARKRASERIERERERERERESERERERERQREREREKGTETSLGPYSVFTAACKEVANNELVQLLLLGIRQVSWQCDWMNWRVCHVVVFALVSRVFVRVLSE